MHPQATLPEFFSSSQLERDTALRALGINGWLGIVDTAPHAATPRKFFAIHCVLETVFDALDGNQSGNTMVGVTFPAGFVIYGLFTNVELASGAVLAYYDRPLMTP